jgi:hypothetical protein
MARAAQPLAARRQNRGDFALNSDAQLTLSLRESGTIAAPEGLTDHAKHLDLLRRWPREGSDGLSLSDQLGRQRAPVVLKIHLQVAGKERSVSGTISPASLGGRIVCPHGLPHYTDLQLYARCLDQGWQDLSQ